MRAYLLIRDAPWYRREAFHRGLIAAGFRVTVGEPGPGPKTGDWLVCWNRYGHVHEAAKRFEADGGKVICCENGYINGDRDSPKYAVHPRGPRPTDYYAVGFSYHNDHRLIKAGGPERLIKLGIELRPLRQGGDHILVAPNRPFGPPDRAMDADWAEKTAQKLRTMTMREVRVRTHPGNNRPSRPLEEDLRGCWAVVIWSSTSGVHALADGIPVVCCAPYWICRAAAWKSIDSVNAEDLGDLEAARKASFERMAWAQWQLGEIETGEPFHHLLRSAREEEVAARP